MDRLVNLLGAQSVALLDRMAAAGDGTLPVVDRAALVTLLAHPDHTVAWLGEVLSLTGSGATRLVDRLDEAGLVERRPGADARSREVRLTAAGRRRARTALQGRHDAVADAVAGLSAADRRELERLTALVVAGLADTREPALRMCRLCDRNACASAGSQCPLEHTSVGAPAGE